MSEENNYFSLLDEFMLGNSIYYLGYDSLYFDRDMELTLEYSTRRDNDEDISTEEQQVYNGASDRLMNYNAHLVKSGINIWERYAQKKIPAVEAPPASIMNSENYDLNFSLAEAKPATANSDLTQTLIDRGQYNTQTSGVSAEYILSPDNPAYSENVLTEEEKEAGVTLQYNEDGTTTKVKNGIPLPGEIEKIKDRDRVNRQQAVEEIEKIGDIFLKDNTEYLKAAQELVFSGDKIMQGSSKAYNTMTINTDRLLLANGILPGQAKVVNLSSTGTENGTDESVMDYISDKWREFETWRERQKYLQALEMTKLSLKTFYGITPDYPGYEDILAVAVKEYLRIQEETPALLMGAQGPITKFVYISRTTNGVVQYVGITNIFARRAAEHLRTKGIDIEPLMNNLSPRDAHAVEQALIEIHGLGSKGGTLMNIINSIAKSNPEYGILIQRGYELLKSIDYGGLIP